MHIARRQERCLTKLLSSRGPNLVETGDSTTIVVGTPQTFLIAESVGATSLVLDVGAGHQFGQQSAGEARPVFGGQKRGGKPPPMRLDSL
jgi:hypothetical protein